MSRFKEISPEEVTENPFKLIGSDWMLVTSGTKTKFNTMTASWGGVGIMWNKPVAFTFIRPQRYTYEFIENEEYFSLSFFTEDFKQALKLCGSKSGRDTDKVAATGLTPQFDGSVPYFAEAKMVFICRKMYNQFLNDESVFDAAVKNCYNEEKTDYHKMYVSEICKVLVRE